MEALTSILPLVAPRITGCSDALALLEIRASWRRFCVDTEAWREEMEMDLLPARATFELPLPYDADVMILRIVDLYREVDDQKSRPDPAEWEIAGEWGAPAIVFRNDLPTTGTLVVEAAFAPLPGLEDPPADPELLTRFCDGIAAGALWKLAAQKGKPWADASQAAESHGEYLRAVGRAKSELIRGRRNGLQTLFGPSTESTAGTSGEWNRVFG